ncbi:MotA/TolQ/ExbB proton channel family protein [Acinetobacter dispersus]|uniref:MotA/TolQ/ExbB proton channel family protein n=1 Tax=Acinetobacter dispersus TaxID=70348 RepID=UPI00132E930A|nr:MotA/TolQ/ExbB proton channel family protein [Acinetobacter dispersus]MCH7384080.1 MotA/TolQ/ExbB proton channel family protein [Acinetobacter dispersus]MCH7391569.1 MotA/TolQ/ExbB proton channel family protein [Acinetobacter dispersus]QHH97906.1 MotA/TolQ/ExbB proton channel family protein [Acinetobacter dispersus]
MINTAKRISRIAAIGLIAGTTLLPVASVWADETTQTTAVTTVATDAAAQAAPTPPPLPATVEKVHNPYGLEALWREGDLVAKSTLFILVLMSIGTWYIILSKVFQQSKIKRHGTEAERHFWEAESLNSAAESLNSNSSYRYIAEKGIRSTKHHDGTLLERIDFNTWVTISIQRAIEKVQSHLSNGLAFLATVGSTAPFVGLFGTVWGIYHALTAIGISGQASIDKVAGPVGEALIMTAIGLAVAVPAVLGYNWLTRRNKAVMDNVRSFGSDLHAVLLSGDLNSNHPNRDSK